MERQYILIVLTISLTIFNISGCATVRSEGKYVGYVDNFTYEGVIWKSWEGEMRPVKAKSEETEQSKTKKFYFSIPSSETKKKKEIIEKIEYCFLKKSKCIISYQEYFPHPLKTKSPNIITNAEIIEEDKKSNISFMDIIKAASSIFGILKVFGIFVP